MTPDYQQQTQRPTLSPLTTLRIIWAALLLGQFAFFVVIALLSRTPMNPSPDPSLLHTLFLVEWVMLVAAVAAAYLLRYLTFSKNQRGDGTVPRPYFVTGTIFFLALLEGASFFSLVVTLLARQLLPYAIPALLAFATQLASFPTGSRLADSDR